MVKPARQIIYTALAFIIIGIIGMLITFSSYKEGAQQTMEETVSIQDWSFDRVDINTDNTRIFLQSTDEQEARVEFEAKGSRSNKYQFDTELDGNTLVVKVKERFSWFSFDFFPRSSDLTVYLPVETYESVQAHTANGKLTAQQLEGDVLALSTNNGTVEATGMAGSTFSARSNNGKISLTSITANTNARTNNGKITGNDITGEITAETDNGSINLQIKGFDYPMNLRTDNGRVHIISQQQPTNAILDLRTSNGRIRAFGTKDWESVYGDGENKITVRTANGAIEIE